MKVKRHVIKVFQDYDGELSLDDLEEAADRLVRARICNTEVRVGFNFLQRLINEVVEQRQDDAELFADVDKIWQDILNEDSDALPKIPLEVYERSKARVFEAIGLTDSGWKNSEGVIKGARIPSEDLTSSETVKMSEDTTDMVQIYDPGLPRKTPPEPKIEMRKPLPPRAGQRRRSVMVHSAAHKYWAEDKSVRRLLMALLMIVSLIVWGMLVA